MAFNTTPIIYDVVFSQHYAKSVKYVCDSAYHQGYRDGVEHFLRLVGEIEKEIGRPASAQDIKDYLKLKYLKDVEAELQARKEAQSTPKKSDKEPITGEIKTSPASKIINLFPNKNK